MKNLKKYSMLAALGLGMVGVSGTAAQAKGAMSDLEFSKDIGVFSQYVWRGQVQGGGATSVQADIGLEHDSGVFANVWGATAVAPTPTSNGGLVTEFDFTLGYAGETKDFGYSAGVVMYRFHNNGGANATEAFVGGTYSIASLDVYYDLDSKNIWADLGAGMDLADFSVDGTLSYAAPDVGTSELANFALGVSKEVEMRGTAMTVSFQYNKHLGALGDSADPAYQPDALVFGVNFAY